MGEAKFVMQPDALAPTANQTSGEAGSQSSRQPDEWWAGYQGEK